MLSILRYTELHDWYGKQAFTFLISSLGSLISKFSSHAAKALPFLLVIVKKSRLFIYGRNKEVILVFPKNMVILARYQQNRISLWVQGFVFPMKTAWIIQVKVLWALFIPGFFARVCENLLKGEQQTMACICQSWHPVTLMSEWDISPSHTLPFLHRRYCQEKE